MKIQKSLDRMVKAVKTIHDTNRIKEILEKTKKEKETEQAGPKISEFPVR